MSVQKVKAYLILCVAVLLCGCGQALSEREIVRAVFFAQQQGQYSVCLLLAVAGIGCMAFVYGGTIQSATEKLLEDGEYTRLSKARSPVIGAVSGGYWLLVTAIFLYYTFGPKGNGNAQYSWFIWAIAGVLFAAIMLVLKTVKRSGKKD